MISIHWSNKVFDDILLIKEHLGHSSEVLGEIFVDKVFEKVELLKTFPRMGKEVTELNRKDIRELIFKQYRIVYRVKSEDKITILTVQHSSRQMSFESIFE
ncbi:MAG: type II toxin-antitoxin system RelE/ParE family toxin [Emticicia sp.]|nr:type II toxin-antitoxin system RelE/ParE family toxin [Emticicia sp.]